MCNNVHCQHYANRFVLILTCMDVSPLQITNCDLGLINDGRLADCFPCLKIREIRFVLVSKAA